MSKARLVVTAVVVEGRTQGEVARAYGVSQGWISRLVARYRVEGEAAFWPRSRRPNRSPTVIPPATVDLIIRIRKELADQGLDAGADTIVWHLRHHHRIAVSRSTVARYLTRAGLVSPQPRKRPRSSYLRFAADLPNECWQSDVTHYPLADGAGAEILSWIDDCSRYALSVTAHRRVTGPIVLASFRDTAAHHGIPASTLTDNAMVYTTRYSGGKGGRNAFEAELRRVNVVQKNSRPNHPTTCGKVERFQQTMKNWLAAQLVQPATLGQLQTLLDAFVAAYNHHRPHRSLPQRATPVGVYHSLPKARPASSRDADTHDRIRRDRVDATGVVTLRHHGRLHHIGVGRTHARTPIIMIIQDLDIRVVDAATGQLLRELTLDPTRDYQPTGRPPGPPKRTTPNPSRGFRVIPMS
jgi:transposase InsO family protein